MTDDVTVTASIALMIRAELNDDDVGLWTVPWHIRLAIPDANDQDVQRIASRILISLLGTGASLGTLDEEHGIFVPWSGEGAVDRAMTHWRQLGRDPNIGEVAWLGLNL
jgi:hypothetical protein